MTVECISSRDYAATRKGALAAGKTKDEATELARLVFRACRRRLFTGAADLD